jgi:hypothetical protein
MNYRIYAILFFKSKILFSNIFIKHTNILFSISWFHIPNSQIFFIILLCNKCVLIFPNPACTCLAFKRQHFNLFQLLIQISLQIPGITLHSFPFRYQNFRYQHFKYMYNFSFPFKYQHSNYLFYNIISDINISTT